jgi:hypothetical protein
VHEDAQVRTPQQLYEAANAAIREAIRWEKDPHGIKLAQLRRRDAEIMRSMAREALRL